MCDIWGGVMLGKVLVILSNANSWLGISMKETGLVDVATAYRDGSYLMKRLRTLNYHLPLSKNYWYGEWKDKLENYNTIILFDVFLGSDMAEFIECVAPKARLIVFYYNPLRNNYHLTSKACSKCEVWSFDKQDCVNHNMHYNHQFFFRNSVKQDMDARYASDVFFIGKDKGRISCLMNLQRCFAEAGLNSKILLIGDRKDYSRAEKKFLVKKELDYSEVLKYNKNTNCILEIVQDNQEGLTRRAVEALFFGKKLITNNKQICEYEIYNSFDVYVIGLESRDICNFVRDRSCTCWNDKEVEKYSFEHWLKQFNC